MEADASSDQETASRSSPDNLSTVIGAPRRILRSISPSTISGRQRTAQDRRPSAAGQPTTAGSWICGHCAAAKINPDPPPPTEQSGARLLSAVTWAAPFQTESLGQFRRFEST